MKEISCMIVDDEPLARDILIKHVSSTPGLKLVKTCMNATEAYEGLYEHAVDLIFLDIQMPVITGVEFMRSLRQPPLVIFTTAYQNYAIEGFELNSVDYLLKPVTYDRFYPAIEKVRERLRARSVSDQESASPPTDHLFIKQDSRLVKLRFSEIKYIEAEKDFSSIFLDDKKLLASMHLKMLEEMLPDHLFMRVHRSYIVNLTKVNSIQGNIIEIGKSDIPIGGNYKSELLRKLGI